MIPPSTSGKTGLGRVRVLLWLLVALAVIGIAVLLLVRRTPEHVSHVQSASAPATFGGPFKLVDGSGKPFSSQALEGKPYALYFGYTRCGDVCPTTLSRMVKLLKDAGGPGALNIVFITIDPANDGPKEVGQYADLFNSPIIGLTGSPAQIDAVKKQFGIYAQPEPDGHGGMHMINHTATVLLFDRAGKFSGTISSDEPDRDATAKLKRLAGA